MRNITFELPNPAARWPARRPTGAWRLLAAAALASGCLAYAASPALTGVDVGFPSLPGATTTAANGKITVVGSGNDIWGAADNFHYAYFKITGDFDYVVKVESLKGNPGDGGWAKAELMARLEDASMAGVGPQPGDPHISNMTTRPSSDTPPADPDTGTTGVAGVNHRGPQWRAQRDGQMSWTAPSPAYPPSMPNNWMRLERVGSVFYMYTSNDGATWNMYNPYSPQGWDTKGSWPPGTDNPDVSVFTEAWPSTVMLGLAVTGHSDAYTAEAVFSNFGPYTPTPIAINKQPEATVSVGANSPLVLAVEAAGDPVHYEWRKDGSPIGTNGLSATFSIPLAQASDSGTYTVRVFGGGQEIISAASVVTVTTDTTPATITEVKALVSPTRLQVTFSEPVTPATAGVAANYQLSPAVAVTAAAPSADGYSVVLTTAVQAYNTAYTLTVSNVMDTAGNVVAAGTKGTFVSVGLLAGAAMYERWNDANGDLGDLNGFTSALGTGTVRPADVTSIVTQFGGPWGAADNYNARVRAYFTPPSSGNYIFYLAADDNAALYLSTDDDPVNKRLIAQENGWSNQYQWTTPGTGSADDKRSDYFPSTEWPSGNIITLQAGKKYYLEVLWNEGTGGDGADVTFVKEGSSDPAQDASGMALKGEVINWYETVDMLPPVIVTQPVDSLTVAAGGSASLSVTATNPGPAALTYQWQRNGNDIAGATSATYNIVNASAADIGQYWVKVSNPRSSVLSGQNDTPTVVLVTFPSVFTIEAEDFNYDGGKSKPEASVMPYQGDAYNGLGAVFDIDYHNTGTTTEADGWTPVYRTGDPVTSGTQAEMGGNNDGQWGKTRAGAWEMTQNYKIGWINSGDWGNYTRTIPAGTYDVFAATSFDGISVSQLNGNLAFVTSGATTQTQTLEPIGTFDAPGSGGWSRNNLVRMTDSDGNPKTITLTGEEKTFRWTYNSGDADYLLFIPVQSGVGGFSSVRLTSGNMIIEWTGGTLESADAVVGPWSPVADAKSPATIPTTGSKKFYRLK